VQTLYAMCGLAFAGKSTAARRISAALGAALVSLDQVHAERGYDPGNDIMPERWDETGRIALERAESLLLKGRSVLVDDTFSYRAQRDRFRAAAARHGCRFLIVYMDTAPALSDAWIKENRRNPKRPDVHPDVVEHIIREFEPPEADEPTVRIKALNDLEAWLAAESSREAH
jgi:predicted kinase